MSGAIGKILLIGLTAQLVRYGAVVGFGKLEAAGYGVPGVLEFWKV